MSKLTLVRIRKASPLTASSYGDVGVKSKTTRTEGYVSSAITAVLSGGAKADGVGVLTVETVEASRQVGKRYRAKGRQLTSGV